MRIALLSDIHDNIWTLTEAMRHAAGADALVFCGDFCAPFSLAQIADGFTRPIHAVWGNNDGDKWLLTKTADAHPNVTLHGDFADIELGGRQIAVTHYPRIAHPLARSGIYDAVCYGHDHTPRVEQAGPSLLINPGEIMGRFGRCTFAWYDTEAGSAEIVDVA